MNKLTKFLMVIGLLVITDSYAIDARCIAGDCVNGQGTVIYSNGDKYVGEFKDNIRNGQGTATFSNGIKYVGEWKDDMPNGQGTATGADGTVKSGLWKNGKLVQ
jgi:hypothetical protein